MQSAAPEPPRRWIAEASAWVAAATATTAALLAMRPSTGIAQVALAYLLIVLGASARLGRRVGLVLAGCCFLAFNFFFVPPYGTLSVADSGNWFVLLAFFATSAVAAQLLHRSQGEAASASRRALELQRLATVGAEALQAPRAEDAAQAIARVIREELDLQECEVYLRDGASDRLRLVARATRDAVEQPAEETREQSAAELVLTADARTLLVPLSVRARSVGMLRLRSDTAVSPDVLRRHFAEVLAYYSALGLERIRLTAAAERADALRAADQLKDAVLSAVSHDLRTPLTTIKAIAHEIAHGGDERAALIETEADRLNRYVSNLLDLSRLNAGALAPRLELVPADDLLGAAHQQAAGIIGAREVRLEVEPGQRVPMGRLDFVLALRALVNLIENAVRYSPSAAPVDVKAYSEGEWLRIDVADRGPGIPETDRGRIFEPFQRGSGVRDSNGAGLGLAIARRLTEAQGGTLSLADRAGGGMTFTLSFPAADVTIPAVGSL